VVQSGLASHKSGPDKTVSTKESVQRSLGEQSFAIAKGGVEKAEDTISSAIDASFFLMSIGYYDNSVKVHSTDSLQLEGTINGIHRGRISCMQVSADGTVVVTGGEDGTCVVWVVDYDDFATAIADGFVQPRDEKTDEDFLQCCHVLVGHTTPITCLSISTKLDVVVSASQDGSICLHNIRSGRFIRALHVNAISRQVENSCAGNAIPATKLAIHSDGLFVAHLCDGSLYVITVNGHQVSSTNAGEILNSIIICPQSETLVTGGANGLARMWKLQDLSVKCTVDVSKYGRITSMLLIPADTSPVAQFLCVGSENGLLSIVFRNPEAK
jgi:WD40 repeat protein